MVSKTSTAAKPAARKAAVKPAAADPDTAAPTTANTSTAIADPAPATTFEASGAVIEPAIVDGVDMSHPAVDANPRANTTAAQNRIDFNDPAKPGSEAVAEQLAAQA